MSNNPDLQLELLHHFIDTIPISCIVWNDDIQAIDCNQVALNTFRLSSKEEFSGIVLDASGLRHARCKHNHMNELVQKAFQDGNSFCFWSQNLPDEDPYPMEIQLTRLSTSKATVVVSCAFHSATAHEETQEANERTQIMLDATPLCCNFWDENGNNIDCNQEAVNLFDLKNKQEYLDRFYELSPEKQPDGQLSKEKAAQFIHKAFTEGYARFEWLHQKLNGEPIPAEITLVRVKRGDAYIVAGYTRDLRETKEMLAKIQEANERTKIMLDATPLCCNFWDENGNNIDCNQEAVNLFELSNKQEYLDRFFELSPKYQPDGRLSEEKAREKIKQAFDKGRVRFEWMHQKLNGDPIPAEITLVRVKRGDSYIVAGYTRDLRELKDTVSMLNQLERLAFTDSVTGAYNHRHFMEKARQAFEEESEYPLSIIMMDIDKFKDVNDTYGHLAGDEILRFITTLAQSALRPYDLLARYGGEEFIVMLHEAKPGLTAILAERIRKKIDGATLDYEGKQIHVTVSLGAAVREPNDTSVEQIIQRADENMYCAKQQGRNRVKS